MSGLGGKGIVRRVHLSRVARRRMSQGIIFQRWVLVVLLFLLSMGTEWS